ncbi:hypothetical protein EGI26_17950 [Lacihabitans sp. CCS-44]|uniref:hypothetical protein n=1 Tax=Lacihabitans sp. CCS-44 TaxID=2487331 RepID=UPI0020CDE50E|nr:hypothetical protein [Lacihabitans sp. CCS-44]MCP9757047.1 hypothetical protein [Lacihabitans sp. CCS-44]
MKKLVLFILLLSATFSLSSFGIVSNPRISAHQTKAGKTIAISSKSEVKSELTTINPLVPRENNDQEVSKEQSYKSFLKTIFGFIISALTEIVMTLISK